MDIIIFDSQQLPIALGVLRGLFPEPSPARDRYLEVIARLHGEPLRADALPSPSHMRVAAIVRDAHRRKRLIQLGALMTMVDGQVMGKPTRALLDLAISLEVKEPVLKLLPSLVARNPITSRLHMTKRIMRSMLGSAWREEGVSVVKHIFARLAGAGEDRATAARYARLARYPAGSLGRAFWEYLALNGFALPGKRAAIPEAELFHDIGHLLSGYGTDPAGEIRQAAFQAGYMRDDGFTCLLFGVLQFHVGLRLTPVTEARAGYFDVESVMTALARGASCTIDLSDGFDFWAFAERPLESLRAELRIPAFISARPSRAA